MESPCWNFGVPHGFCQYVGGSVFLERIAARQCAVKGPYAVSAGVGVVPVG